MAESAVYDHRGNAGNEGDVPKHVLIARLVELMCPSRDEFVYAESHAGRSRYLLSPSGEWRKGVGQLFSQPAVTSPNGDPSQISELRAFIELYRGEPPAAGKAYLGSSRVARDALRRRRQDYRIELWDTDQAVTSELHASYVDDPNVHVHTDDGYAGIVSLPRTSLVLVDPPDIDAERVLEIARWLTLEGRTFMCWTPLRSRPRGGKGEGAIEAGTSSGFLEQTKNAGYGVVRVRWGSWGERTPGCQITVSTDIERAAERCVSQTADLMGWRHGPEVDV